MRLEFNEAELDTLAKKLLTHFGEQRFLCFYGPMGVGKTTLIKAIIKELGAVDLGNSPTFGLVNEYHDAEAEVLAYHFDFYRLENEDEAWDMGLEEYFHTPKWVFVEWPQKIKSLLPDNKVTLKLHFTEKSKRCIEIV